MPGDTAFALDTGGPGILKAGVPGFAPIPEDPFRGERLTPVVWRQVDGVWKHIDQPSPQPPPFPPLEAGGRHLRLVDAPSEVDLVGSRIVPGHMGDPDAPPRRRSSAAPRLVAASSPPGSSSSAAGGVPLGATGTGYKAKVALYLLALTAAAAVWYFAVGTLLVSRGTPLISGWDVTTVASGSMRPVLREGDLVAYRSIDVGDLRPGQIIVFDSPVTPGATVVHRFIGFNDDGTLTTKGDANGHSDSTPVPAHAVRGTVSMVTRLGGYPTMLLLTGEHLRLAILVAVLVLSAVVVHAPVPQAVRRSPAGPPRRRSEAVGRPVPSHGVPGSPPSPRVRQPEGHAGPKPRTAERIAVGSATHFA